MEHVALALHVEAVHVAHHRQHFGQSHVLELDRDLAGHPGVHRHAVAGALEQGAEKLHRIHIVGGNAQPRFRHADGLGRTIELQQFALYRLGYAGQRPALVLLGHGMPECVLGLHGFGVPVAGTACRQHGGGDQAEMMFFHVISAP